MQTQLRQDRNALHWIRGELDQTLREARASLQDYVDGQQDRLAACVDLLHHVHGALEMVQVYGGAMLADELEQLATAMAEGRVKRADAAAEALMLGMVQLPAYLEKIERGGADVPLVLLPLMNDLRSAHDAPLVSESSLFAPKLDAVIAAETVRPGSGNRDLPRLIHQLRSHYHRELLNWIRGQDTADALGQIRDMLDELNSAAGTARFRRLLDAAQALACALLDDQGPPAAAVKPLFGKVDQVFKRVIDQGEERAMLDFPSELLKNILYYVARSNSSDPVVLAVKRAADLANTFADQQSEGAAVGSLGAPDQELFQAVAEALTQDLRDVKDRFDLYIRSDRGELTRLTGLAQPIQRIADTLGMVGRGELRTRLKHRCDELRAAEQSGEPPADERLMTLAEDLLFVESALASIAAGEESAGDEHESTEGAAARALSGGEMQQHLQAAIDEALAELAKTKDAILGYLDKPDHPELLSEVPSRLHVVAGVLRMLELPEAAHLLHDLKPYIAGLATGQTGVPDAAQRDALADVVISAELYMQSAIEPGGDRTKLLSYAEAALQRLGLRAGAAVQGETVLPRDDAAAEIPVAEQAAAGELPQEPAVPEGGVVVGMHSGERAAEPPEPVLSRDDAAAEIPEAGVEEPIAAGELPHEPAAPADKVAVDMPPAVSSPPETGPAGPAVDAVDSEILEVFSEEAAEELQVVEDCFPKWRSNPDDRESLQTMRRSFHTLKGSGRIVGALNLGEFSWAVENLLNRVIEGTQPVSPELMQLMGDVVRVLPALVEESGRPDMPATDVSALAARAFALAAGEEAAVSPPEQAAVDVGPFAEDATILVEATDAPVPAVYPDEAPSAAWADYDGRASELAEEAATAMSSGYALADESILTAGEVHDSELSDVESSSMGGADSSLSAVFLGEVQGHLAVLGDFLRRCRDGDAGEVLEDGVRRALHTLRGSARTAGVEPIAELAGALEAFADVLHGRHSEIGAPILDVLERSHGVLQDMAAQIEDPQLTLPEWRSLLDRITALTDGLAHAPAAQAEAEAGGIDETVDPELLEVFLDEAKELLETMEAELADWEHGGDSHAPVAQLQRTLHTMKGGARLAGVAAVGDLSHALESVFEGVVERRVDGSDRLKGLVRHATDLVAQDIDRLVRGSMPAAHPEMVERLEAAAHGADWNDWAAPADAAAAPSPTPEAAVPAMREPVPAGFEDLEQEAAAADDLDVDSEMLADSQLMTDSELLEDSTLVVHRAGVPEFAADAAVTASDSTVVQFPGGQQLAAEHGFVPRRPLPDEPPAAVGGSERVRVASDVLDQMVNNAGEVSIYRARIEQQNSSFEFHLDELSQTIDRLRGQLRGLELETEAQIRSGHEREADSWADFDPLEMDRYSTIQQLSRALSETVEDLSNLGRALSDLSRDTDTLLLQQARVTTDLQDSLLRTRMVKFSSRVPRLERVVRQTCHSIGKQAALDVKGGGEDMDRAILERMMGPLEHLLRNAVSHGIEDADIRRAAGKAPQGTITLQLARDGTDVVLRLSDDGAGLDRARIRAKAEERGLLAHDAMIEDGDLYQLILQPGFSTAQALSQVSGRGVGMDVVLTEVKQLGGSLDIDSQPGQGTTFTIRLPFTLAITDALLVTLGDDIFAVPHSSMDGVVRIPVDELRAIYSGETQGFQYAGRDYNVRYLGSMLGIQAPQLVEGARWLPLLLVRSGDHRVAFQVDGLLGNRQIVVKSIGAQLSGVRWFTGGTILADGQIALILDTNALLRMEGTQQVAILDSAVPLSKGVSVMVVDDSITVRKVTSRLLERHNMQVLTAKDGVDAVTLLQEHHPDVMLLDIEMPRMDGYELARHMRSTPELSNIPIIMITSRTGDKHRNRAVELGVKRYLGKPYQEAELLENIYTVLADTAL